MNKKHVLTSFLLVCIACAGGTSATAQVSGTTIHLLLPDQQVTAEVNGDAETLETPAFIENESFYVPIKWVGDKLGFKAKWDADRRTVGMTTSLAYLEWDLDNATVSVNGTTSPSHETAIVRDGSLFVKLSWIAAYLQVNYSYRANPNRVELSYVQQANSAYRESTYPEDTQRNSRPVAKFHTDKKVYRIGETIHYIDLSYDADAEGLPQYEWMGKEEAFFAPGTYTISLRVRDGDYNWSHPFTQTVTVSGDILLTASEYPWHTKPIGTVIRDTSREWSNQLQATAELPMLVTRADGRKRMISGENHTIQNTGLIYRDQLSGKGRLVSHHVNGMGEAIQLATLIRNPSDSQTLVVHVTRKGQIATTLFHAHIGRDAVADFMTQPLFDEVITVKPGQTATLERFLMESGQGVVSISDIETTGDAEIGFVVLKSAEEPQPLESYGDKEAVQMEQASHAYENIYLDVEAAKAMQHPAKWTMSSDPQYGSDGQSDLGTEYLLRIDHPRKAAIAVQAKSGTINGVMRINGNIVPFPQGGMTDQDGALLVYRLDGSETSLDIEWMTAPGSKSPVEWIFYPLLERNEQRNEHYLK